MLVMFPKGNKDSHADTVKVKDIETETLTTKKMLSARISTRLYTPNKYSPTSRPDIQTKISS